MRAKNPFTTITSSGMLLPIDLLVRIADGDARLPGLTPDAYHLRSGERLNEAASRAWTQCKAAWDSFRRKLAVLPASDTATTLTRNEWLLPLFQELDYGRLQPKPAIFIDEKTYPVSHRWEEHVPIHLLSAKIPLDKRTAGVDGAATRSPYSMVQELLNRSGKFRWGMVSNGLKLYLLRDNNSLSRAANVEFDLEAMMDGEVYADFMLLWLLCHQSRVEILSTGVGGQVSGFGGSTETQGAGKKAKGKGKASGKTAKSATRKTGKLLIDDEDDEDSNVSLDTEDDPDLLDEVDSTAISPTPDPRPPAPDSCWLERWTKEAESRGTRAREKLRNGVENAINALGAGFLETRGNEVLKHRLTTGALDKQDYYRQLLRIVYRLLLLLFAEEKKDENGQNLLHPPGTPDSVRQRYAKFYSVGRLRDLAGLRRGTSHTDLYESLKVLFEKLREGYEPLGIPGLGSFLFSKTATPDLDNAHLSNVAVLDCFRQLGYTDDDSKSRRVVDFGNLGSEELGSVYESLLELHPKINSDKGPFILDCAAGSERKTTGSYYTPTSLINCLLDSALDPVIDEAIKAAERMASGEWGMVEEKFKAEFVRYCKVNERDAQIATLFSSTPLAIRYSLFAEHALLSLKICDPACGSGHFLIAAAERLALHLARIRTGDDQPSTMAVQHAKRDVIGRCIYGVDLNPMAVELCKISLWMEALDPGRPLSFLDHHIQCGNSLLGTTPALLEKGIPDDAFNPIEGDVKAVCTDLKKRNKRERADRESGQGYLFETYIKLGNLPSEFRRLSSDRDDSVAAVDAKAKKYAELVSGAEYLNARLLADLWCAAFVWKKDVSDLGKLCPTERDFRNIEDNPHSILPHVKSEVRRLSDQYGFIHWHLAFPDVFHTLHGAELKNHGHVGWGGGFDVVLANPPWEKVNLIDTEYFASRNPDIAAASTKSERRRLIDLLKQSEPMQYAAYLEEKRSHDFMSVFFRFSGRYPLTGVSRVNSYSMFAEIADCLIGAKGAVGIILPTGIVTDDNNKEFFQKLIQNGSLISLCSFDEIRDIFLATDSRNPFCLLCFAHRDVPISERGRFVFFAKSVDDMRDNSRNFTLTFDDLQLINPTSYTCPTFRTLSDAELTKHTYRTVRAWCLFEHTSTWPGTPKTPFNMSNDSHLFLNQGLQATQPFIERDSTSKPGDYPLPVYESKLVYQFNHRFASFADSADLSDEIRPTTLESMADQYFVIRPRFWISRPDAERRFQGRWFLVYRMITNSASERTTIATVIPEYPCVNSLSLIQDLDAENAVLMCANMNSYMFDYIARQKIAGNNFNHWIWKQLPQPSPADWRSAITPLDKTASQIWLLQRVLELTYTAWDLEPFALDCGYDGPPFRWDEERRFLLRCELDAAYFHLYLGSPADWGKSQEEVSGVGGQVSGEKQEQVSGAGGQVSGKRSSPETRNPAPETRSPPETRNLKPETSSALAEMFPTPRHAVEYIMETFPIVKRKDVKAHGDYRTKLVILELYDQMQQAIETGVPFHSQLDPPAGPPTDSEGNFIPMADWDQHHWPSHIHPPRNPIT